jgi:hypothetical protein
LKNIAGGNPQDFRFFFIIYLSQLLSKTIYGPKKENFYFESEEKMITFEQNIPALFRLSLRARVFGRDARVWKRGE